MVVRNWMMVLGVTAIACVAAVALIVATRAPEMREPDYLSQDEIDRLAATRVVGYKCGVDIQKTSKADEIERRAVGKVNEEAIARAEENLKNTDCAKLLVRFPDMMTRKGDCARTGNLQVSYTRTLEAGLYGVFESPILLKNSGNG